MSPLVLAFGRVDVANYVSNLAWVYSLLIIAYILSQLFFNFGGRMPYARWSSAILAFLNDTVEPYLRIFRRIIPPLGPLDLSAIVAIIALRIVASIVSNLIAG